MKGRRDHWFVEIDVGPAFFTPTSPSTQRVIFSLCFSAVLFVLTLTLASSMRAQDAQSTKNILVLHTYNANTIFNKLWSEAFREIVGKDVRYQVYEEFFDYDRLPLDGEVLARNLRQRYAGHRMDVVVASGRIPMQFLRRYGEDLWPGAMMIYAGADSRIKRDGLPAGTTGVFGKIDFGATVELALRLIPGTRHVFYVGGIDPAEETWRLLVEDDFGQFAGKVEITYLNNLPLPKMLDQLSRLPDHSVVIYPGLFRDASGQSYAPDRVCSLITASSNSPVFSTFRVYVGCGIVGGVVFDTEAFAEETAHLTLRALQRGSAAGLPIEHLSPNQAVVDWRQLHRWNIPESRLPAGAIIRYREATVWERYKGLIISALAILLTQLGLIIALVLQRRRSAHADAIVRSLSGRLINAGEEERKRLARELHDDIGQRLSLVSIELDVIEQTIRPDMGTSRESLHEVQRLLSDIISDIHGLSHRLHSSKLQALGLQVALKDVCQQFRKQYRIEIEFCASTLPHLGEEIGICFYRVAQEALNNCVKHSSSTRIQVLLTAHEGTLTMKIRDNGRGFDLSAPSSGLGLDTMRERLRSIGGKLVILSRPGKGTELTAEARVVDSLGDTSAA